MKTRTKSEIEKELVKLRQRITELEASDSKRTSVHSGPEDRKVEQELRETRDYLENLINYANTPIIAWDPDFRITRFNHAFERLTGYKSDDVVGKELSILFPDASRTESMDRIKATSDGEYWETVEIPILCRGGDIRLALWNSANIYTEDGRTLLATIAQGQDITERKQAESQEARKSLLSILADVTEKEQTLQESEEKYREVFDNISEGIYRTTPDGKIILANPAFVKMLGYDSFGELAEINVTREEYKSSADRQKFIELINKNERVYGLESKWKKKDGTVLLVRENVNIVRDENGNALYWDGTVEDITERKQVEEKLRAALEYSCYLVDSSLDMIISVDQERRIVEFNEAAQRTFGYNKAEVLGKSVDLLYADPEVGRKAHNTAKITGRFSAEIVNKRKNGELFPSILSASILQDKKGEFLGIMGVSRDITKVKQSEKEKEDLQAQLFQSQKMEAIGELASGIAHDFNNLLTIISGYSQFLLGDLDKDSPIRNSIEKIYETGKRAAILIRQLLAFSRKLVLESKVMDLNTIATDIEKMIGRLIGEDIKMDTVMEPDLMHVKVDPGQIEQVIMNLVVNARDAMPDGGEITVRTENVVIDKELSKVIPESLQGRFVCFSVEDTGVGIDKAILDQIFEPFFTTKEVGVGTGLGLSVAYGIIKQHDGWINVYSGPGKGTVFKIYLPAVFDKIDSIIKDTIFLKNIQGNGERILLVEDDEGIREFAAVVLRENGYTIFEAANAKEAFELFKSEDGNFNLVFSDVVMPGKSGLQLVDELLSDKPDLQVLLCSGYSDKKSKWHEIKKRGFRFLQKPYAVTDLLKSIKEAIQKEVS